MPDTTAADTGGGSLDHAVITTETGGTIKAWNAVAGSTYGWTAEEAIGRSIYDLLIPQSRRGEALNMMAGVSAGRVWAGQFVLRHRDGSPLGVSMTSSPVYGVGRGVAGIVSVSTLLRGTGARQTRTARILVAEDDPRSRELMVEILRDGGYEVVEVSDGALALGALRDRGQAFDMVVLDMQMPGVDGLVVASAIRREPRLRDLPVLAVTALTQPGDAVRVLEAGCDAYLAKPVSVREVRKMVTEMLVDSRETHQQATAAPRD